jgi:hypothetical protein
VRKLIKNIKKEYENHLTRKILTRIAPTDVDKSEYIFLFNQMHSKFAEKLYLLMAYELAQKNIPAFFLYENELIKKYLAGFVIDGIAIENSLQLENKRYVKSKLSNRQNHEWQIDIDKKTIATMGINFFNLIETTLQKIQKRYNVFYYSSDNKPLFSELVRTCDVLLSLYIRLKKYAIENQKKIRLVGWEANYMPNGVLRLLCEAIPTSGAIEFIEFERGYMHYFGANIKDSYVSCSNLTKTKAPFGWMVNKEEFRAFQQLSIDTCDMGSVLNNLIKRKTNPNKSSEREQIIKTVESYKKSGKAIYVLFAHLFYDTPVDDQSNAFDGMCDWLDATIDRFNHSGHLLLLKPHPVEIRVANPKKMPNETLASYLKDKELNDNVILLPPDLFSVADLIDSMSCALIWRSSVALELTYHGIPCIIAGKPYYEILNIPLARSREEYFTMIETFKMLEIAEKQKDEIKQFLYMLKSRYNYIAPICYDSKNRKHHWDGAALKHFLVKGDAKIGNLIEQVL